MSITCLHVQGWGPLVRWSAGASVAPLDGDVDEAPVIGSAPVIEPSGEYGALTNTSENGLNLNRDAARSWLPRFAAQVGSLLQLFDLRREYGRHMRQSQALLDAVQRLQGDRGGEGLARALCETALDVSGARGAGLVRWDGDSEGGEGHFATAGAGRRAPRPVGGATGGAGLQSGCHAGGGAGALGAALPVDGDLSSPPESVVTFRRQDALTLSPETQVSQMNPNP